MEMTKQAERMRERNRAEVGPFQQITNPELQLPFMDLAA